VRWTALAPGCNCIEDGGVKTPRLFLVAAAVSLVFASFARAESDWLHDWNKAQEEAKTNHKLLFLNFTGSDWCGWCIKFDKDVLSQPQFKISPTTISFWWSSIFPAKKSQPSEEKKAKRATGSAVRSSWISDHRRAEQQRPKGLAVRRLFPRWPGGVYRAAAEIAEGLSAPFLNPSRIDSSLEQIRAATAKNIRRILLPISSRLPSSRPKKEFLPARFLRICRCFRMLSAQSPFWQRLCMIRCDNLCCRIPSP